MNSQYLFPTNAIKYLFEEAGIGYKDLISVWGVSRSRDHQYDFGETGFNVPLPSGLKKLKINFITHHKAHILSGYYLSPFEESVGLCVDGNGSVLGLDFNHRETITAYYLSNPVFNRIYHLPPNYSLNEKGRIVCHKNSLGHFYYNFAVRCIPAGDEPEGSLMALSALGKSDIFYNDIKALVDFFPNGMIQIHLPYGDGLKESEIINIQGKEFSISGCADIPIETRANLARAVQCVFEEAVLHILDHLWRVTRSDSVILTGGGALNSKLNGSITKRSQFKSVFIPPAPHDAGTAIGAALYGWCHQHGFPKPEIRRGCSWGPNIVDVNEDDEYFLKDKNYEIIRCQYEDDLLLKTAELISEDKIIGWVRGRMEFGPRALGHRSILANPSSKDVKNRLNEIKKRAFYRPFAVSILDCEFSNWFTGEADPYMNKVAFAKNPEPIIEMLHADQSVRVQVVDNEHHDFYELINHFFTITGIPLLVNTSLNLKGKPIVKDKHQAIQSLLSLSLDGMAIGNTLILRK